MFVNAGPGCAMRAPGDVPGAFALEQMVDELAEKLGIDAIALRDRIDPVRPDAKKGASVRSASVGARRHAPVPNPARSSAASALLSRNGVPTSTSVVVRSPHSVAMGRSRSAPACRTSAQEPAGAGAGRRRGVGPDPEDATCASATRNFPPARRRRQPHHGLDHAAGAQRGLSAPPTALRAHGAGAGDHRR